MEKVPPRMKRKGIAVCVLSVTLAAKGGQINPATVRSESSG